MTAPGIQRWMTANGVREIKRCGTGEYGVILTCGGPGGYDTSIAKALARARDANREWLEWAA